MNATSKYFRLAVINPDTNEIERLGTKVFENHNFSFYSGISNNNLFIDIIYKFIASSSIEKVEEDLINRGFAPVDISGIPEELLSKVPYLICNKHSVKHSILSNPKQALEWLNRYLPLMTDDLILYLKRK